MPEFYSFEKLPISCRVNIEMPPDCPVAHTVLAHQALQTGIVGNSSGAVALMERSEIRFASLKTPIEGEKAILSGSSLTVKIGQ